MGGKQKQAQRTKGNVKPSSSGRSAALLGNASYPVFPSLNDSIFPTFQNSSSSDDLDPKLDPNFQIVLKKMNKKDSVTRVKALQEFAKLVENSDLEALKLVLPLWPKLYCILSGDAEHKVREAANDAQRIVVVQAKKNIAPYLRSFAGPWFIAQFDTYPPAASAAIRSFQDAFPSGKLTDAIVYCQEDILKFISDNLLDQSLGKIDRSEQAEKQERNIIMCLQGLANFLENVPENEFTKPLFLDICKNLFEGKQFWKLAADKIPMVRSAWLAVLSLMLRKVPHLLHQHHQQVVHCVLGRLDDGDAMVLPSIWQATLNILVSLDDWSEYCKVDSQILPLLWQVLREGGYGCASSVFPNMLPLLNILLKTKKSNEDKQTLVDLFFDSLREGFSKRSVQQSRSESEAVGQCYMECIRFVGTLSILGLNLVHKHLIPVIENFTTDSKFNLLCRSIFEHTSSLLCYWSIDESVPEYAEMCICFWNSLLDMYKKILTQPHPINTKTYIMEKQIDLCLILKDHKKFKTKTSQKVRFKTDKNVTSPRECERDSDSCTSLQNIKHQKHLQKFVFSVSMFYLQELKERRDICLTVSLCKLLIEFNDPCVFQDLVCNYHFPNLFRTLLKESDTSSQQFMEIIVEFAFCLLHYVQDSEKEEILKIICEIPDTLVLLLRNVKSKASESYVSQWLRAPLFNEKLVALSKNICNAGDSTSARSVLLECVTVASDGAFLVSFSTISSILSVLEEESNDTEIAAFAAQFLATLDSLFCKGEISLTSMQKENLSSCTYKLVHVLFRLCCQQESLPVNLIPCISMGWQDGVKLLVKINDSDKKCLVTKFSTVVWDNLLSRKTTVAEMDYLMDMSVNLINLMAPNSLEMGCSFLYGVLPKYKSLEQKLKSFCENVEVLLGASISNFPHQDSVLLEEEINQYILLSLFFLNLITKLLLVEDKSCSEKEIDEHDLMSGDGGDVQVPLHINKECDGNDRVEVEGKTLVKFQSSHQMYEFILQIGLAVSLCDILRINFQSMAFYSFSQCYIKEIRSKFSDFMLCLSKEERNDLSNMTVDRAKQSGDIWIHTIFHVVEKDHWMTLYKNFIDNKWIEYYSQVFFMNAAESDIEVPYEILGDNPPLLSVAFWLKHLSNAQENTHCSEIIQIISEWKDLGHKELLYDCNISEKPLNEVHDIIKKMQFLSVCMRKCPYLMKQSIWDFVIISAAYYTQNLKHLRKHFSCTEASENILKLSSTKDIKLHKICIFSTAVFDLLSCTTEFCHRVKRKEFVGEYDFDVSEWNNVFACDVQAVFSDIFISLSESLKESQPSVLGNIFLQKLCDAVTSIYEDFSISDEPSKLLGKRMMSACCKLIHSSVTPLQITAHNILNKIIMHIVENDAVFVNNENLDENGLNVSKLDIHPLLCAMHEMQSVVDIMLAEFSFGDSCIVQSHTDTYYYTAAYLLLWNVILKACEYAGSELRYQYATALGNEGYLSSLLNNLFYLMPAEVLETTVPKTKFASLVGLFSDSPEVSVGMECTSHQLQHWACWVYYSVVSRLPALVRQWWSDTKPKTKAMVQKATVQYVTPLLCSRELHTIQNQTTRFQNMEVKVHIKAREVIAVYAIDEAQMELVISLPEEYPLATIQVSSHSSSLVGTSQWQNWVNQIRKLLTHQNGSLWDGLLLWKSNLDKRFEGVEECYICFSILHGTNFQIPKLCCKTCKKKFHSPCLYKWFSTSNKSTCPICRNIF